MATFVSLKLRFSFQVSPWLKTGIKCAMVIMGVYTIVEVVRMVSDTWIVRTTDGKLHQIEEKNLAHIF